jgi:hypothetical protein
MNPTRVLWGALLCASCLIPLVHAGEPDKKDSTKKAPTPGKNESSYLLRYKFVKGETLRWQVEHQAQVRTTVSGTTQTAETTTDSVKSWKVTSVDDKGQATFVHSVESIDMRQKLTGRQEVRYNSQTDKEIPVGFQDAAKSVGVPLSVITLDASGKVVKREDRQPRTNSDATHITIPLPEEPVPLGYEWTMPYEMTVTAADRTTRKVKLQHKMVLESVKNGIATIHVSTQLLTPINDPAMEAQLVQSETDGKIRFDMDAGRVVSQKCDLDKHVVGFQGPTSSLHYVTRFTEKLLPAGKDKTASRAPIPAGPPLPPKPGVAATAKTAPATKPAPVVATKPAPVVAAKPAPTANAKPAPVTAAKPGLTAKPAPVTSAKPAPKATARPQTATPQPAARTTKPNLKRS